jgi:hypothetical protein
MKEFLLAGFGMFLLVWAIVGGIVGMVKLGLTPPAPTFLMALGMLTGGLIALATMIWLAQKVWGA